MKKVLEVCCGIIEESGKMYAFRRGGRMKMPGKWEFPGGKVESSEELENTIMREILEELKVSISVQDFLVQVYHEYPDFRLKMDTFICKIENGEPTLTEHIDLKWLFPSELSTLDWAAADLPIVEKLMSNG